MPFFRVERTQAPVVFFIEAPDAEEAHGRMQDILEDPHIGGRIYDWELELTETNLDPEPYEGFNEDQDWCVFWDETDQRYYWQ